MTTVDEIHAALKSCSEKLNGCAEMIRNAKLEPVKQNVERIGCALTYIFEIQHEIYKTNPELKPEELKNPKLDSKNRVFGNLLLEVDGLCEMGKPRIALVQLEAFIASQPGEKFEEMARCQIARIKEQFQV